MRPLAVSSLSRYTKSSMMMSIALRFIPTLMEETDKIMNAQKARGADFESGNHHSAGPRRMVPLLVPLFVSAFRRADDLALAMEAPVLPGRQVGRTRMKPAAHVEGGSLRCAGGGPAYGGAGDAEPAGGGVTAFLL